MTHRRPRSPGSFDDDLGELIERLAPADEKWAKKQNKSKEDRPNPTERKGLFESAWRKDD